MLIWNFTKGEQHITDVTKASRTMLFNIHTMDWDEELLALFRIPKSMLPQVKQSSEVYAHTKSVFLEKKYQFQGLRVISKLPCLDKYALKKEW